MKTKYLILGLLIVGVVYGLYHIFSSSDKNLVDAPNSTAWATNQSVFNMGLSDEKSIEEYQQDAKQGDASAQFLLGMAHHVGHDFPKDYAEAMKWYMLSANQGNALAQLFIGIMYKNGEGVPKNYGEAVRWYRLSAEQGYALAQYNLALMYGKGVGIPKDNVMAYKWYNLSAGLGNHYATKAREIIEKEMTPSQIEEAQRLSREWYVKRQK